MRTHTQHVFAGKIVRLSRDHRPEDPEEKERIESLGGRVITLPQDAPRLNGTLSVSRGFGDFDLQPCLSPEPYINIVPISPDDRYLSRLIVPTMPIDLRSSAAISFLDATVCGMKWKKTGLASC